LEVLKVQEEPDFIKVIRWPRAIPQYTIGHLDRISKIESLAEKLKIVVAGNIVGGVSVNDCIAQGKKVVEKVGRGLCH
jgi:oxygen-dependent protoporphyrinogen oxidase